MLEKSRQISSSVGKPKFASLKLSSIEGITLPKHPLIAKSIVAVLLCHVYFPFLLIRRRAI